MVRVGTRLMVIATATATATAKQIGGQYRGVTGRTHDRAGEDGAQKGSHTLVRTL